MLKNIVSRKFHPMIREKELSEHHPDFEQNAAQENKNKKKSNKKKENKHDPD